MQKLRCALATAAGISNSPLEIAFLLILAVLVPACGPEPATGPTIQVGLPEAGLGSASESGAPVCGNGLREANEDCDEGLGASACPYGEKTCTVCNAECKRVPGLAAYCGDGVLNPGEECDDGAQPTANCAPGQTSCMVCSATCKLVPGNTAYCGDGRVGPGEECDDGNQVTEACAYGATSCTVCDASCKRAPGKVAYCGDGVVSDSEECDSATGAGTACAYGEQACLVCNSQCRREAGTVAYCGDGVVSHGEECDDRNSITEECPVTDPACIVCGAGCKRVRGRLSSSGSCGDGVTSGTEQCDEGDKNRDVCPAGQSQCTVCNTSCERVTLKGSARCGDGRVDPGEDCDDGNAVTELCPVGVSACMVCNAMCYRVPGATQNSPPTATNLSAPETYIEDASKDLVDIVVTDIDSPSVTVTLTLSNPLAGALTTATSGVVSSTYNSALGLWTATGPVADVNALLSLVAFVPAPNFTSGFTIATSVSDGVAAPITGLKSVLGIDDGIIEVNSTGDITADDGTCTLREAITAANTQTASGATPGECTAGGVNTTIQLPAGMLTFASSALTITGNMTLVGSGSGLTFIKGNGVGINVTSGGVVFQDCALDASNFGVQSGASASWLTVANSSSTVSLSGAWQNSGTMRSFSPINVGAGSVANDGSASSTAAMAFFSTGTITNTGTLYGGGTTTLSTTSSITNSGTLLGGGGLTVAASSLTNNLSATMSSTTLLSVTTSGNVVTSGNIYGGSHVSVTSTGSMTNNGNLEASGNITVDASAVTNASTATMSSSLALSLTTTGNISNSGALKGGSSLGLSTPGTATNTGGTSSVEGTMTSFGTTTIAAGTFVNNSYVNSAGNLTVTAATFRNETIDGDTREWYRFSTGSDTNDSTNAYYSFPDNYEIQYWSKTWVERQRFQSAAPAYKPHMVAGGVLSIGGFTTGTNIGAVLSGSTLTLSGSGGATFTNNVLQLDQQDWRQGWEIYTHWIALGPLMYDDHVRQNDDGGVLQSVSAVYSIGAGAFATTLNAGGFTVVNQGAAYPWDASP